MRVLFGSILEGGLCTASPRVFAGGRFDAERKSHHFLHLSI